MKSPLKAISTFTEMLRKISPYWLCQICGWSAYALIYTFFYLTISTKPTPNFFSILMLDTLTGLLVTHLMRTVIKRFKLMDKELHVQIGSLIGLTLLFSFLYGLFITGFNRILPIESNPRGYGFLNYAVRVAFGAFLFLFIWNSIYFIYYYVSKSRKELLERLRLETLVKELELKTIKAHINPHFIFNALNSIRALVDENPGRARTAITELSNILRSSMKADMQETTPLERELNIVKDYLALEQIRFEHRLQVSYDIDEDTLDQPIPPMMLQTLVENAIKHGISKHVDGGTIHVISDFKADHHEIIVRNTGVLTATTSTDGFGLSSTRNRLKILFGEAASFSIQDIGAQTVEAKIILPIQLHSLIK